MLTELAPAYRYRATSVAVHDGDTFTARVDVGFRTSVELELRIADVYAPELNETGGLKARDTLAALIFPVPLVVETRKAKRTGRDLRSFERYVADVYLPGGIDVAQALVDAGVASRTPPA